MTSDLSAVLKNINISLLKESEYSNQFPDDRHGTWGQWTSNLLEEWKITFHVDPSLAVCVFSVSWPSDGIIQIILTKLDISEFAGTATRPHHTSSISDNWKYQFPNVTRSEAVLCGIVALKKACLVKCHLKNFVCKLTGKFGQEIYRWVMKPFAQRFGIGRYENCCPELNTHCLPDKCRLKHAEFKPKWFIFMDVSYLQEQIQNIII